MEYISHSDYTKMLKDFGKETPKGMLKEAADVKNPGKYAGGPRSHFDKDGDGVPDGADKSPMDGTKKEGSESTMSTNDAKYPNSWQEGLNLPSPGMKATGQTIVANEGAAYNFSLLPPDIREQLKEYINSIKTIKEEIKKILEKAKPAAKMEDKMGGDRTNLVMTKNTMSEDDKERMSDEEAEEMIKKHEKEKKDKEDYEASIH